MWGRIHCEEAHGEEEGKEAWREEVGNEKERMRKMSQWACWVLQCCP